MYFNRFISHKALIILILFSVLLNFRGQAQDLVINQDGDSINCNITQINDDYLFYKYLTEGKARQAVISLQQVKYYCYGFYMNESDISYEKLKRNEYHRFRLSLSGGWSYRTYKVDKNFDPGFQNYYKELKQGMHWGGDFNFMLNKQFAIGLKYSQFANENSLDDVYYYYEDGSYETFTLRDNVKIQFLGLSMGTRFASANRNNYFNFLVSVGYTYYENKNSNSFLIYSPYYIDALNFTASTVGICWELGYDILINQNLAFGISISFLQGTLSEFNVTNGTGGSGKASVDLDFYNKISRLDISLGIKLYK